MSAKNLRIIYQNLVDVSTSTLTASSEASASTLATNMKKDSKSVIWRSRTFSTNTVKANFILTFTNNIVGGVVLPFCNFSPTATIRVRGWTNSAPTHSGTAENPTITATGTLVFDTGTIDACPYQQLGLWDWGAIPFGVNSYAYGGGTYARDWVTEQLSCTSISVEVVDTNTSRYLEASRMIVGPYWSPIYNTSFGLSTSMKDMSSHERSESGDLITDRGIRYNTMNFDLKWLTPSDRLEFTRIVRGNGLPKPLLISLFPDNIEDWEKEQSHQIYGKLSELSDVQHPMFGIYSAQINIEEI